MGTGNMIVHPLHPKMASNTFTWCCSGLEAASDTFEPMGSGLAYQHIGGGLSAIRNKDFR